MDRLLYAGYCGNKVKRSQAVLELYAQEMESTSNYRNHEIVLITATAYFLLKEYSKSLGQLNQFKGTKPSTPIQLQTNLLLTKNYLALGQKQRAQQHLGNPIQYQQIHQY